jgi:hypothetical protein
MPGGEWGFQACTNNGSVQAPFWLTMDLETIRKSLQQATDQQQNLMTSNVQQHADYWDTAAPGKTFEHWRFEYGYKLGWSDAKIFFNMRASGGGLGAQGGDKIGCLEVWIRKRILDAGQTGDFVWEFEQGFRKAIADFYCALGI